MKYNLSAMSLNRQMEYTASGVEANSPFEAREAFRASVMQGVRREYGITPRGVPYLVDPRTVEIEEAKDGESGEVPVVS